MFSIFVPAIIGAFFFKSLPNPIKVLYAFICMTAFIEVFSSILFAFGKNNIVLYEIHTYIEFLLISAVYFLIFKGKIIRATLMLSTIIFVVYLLRSSYLRIESEQLDTKSIIIESIILIAYFVYYMVSLLGKSKHPYLETQPYFILTSGLLLYFVGNLFVYFFYDYLDGESFLSIWTIHSLLNLFLNFIYVVVLWRSKKALPN